MSVPAIELRELCVRVARLTPEAVLAEAAEETSPLHEYFEWDDTEAARRFRLLQASALIRKCRVSVEVAPETVVNVRQFVHIPAETGRGYYDFAENALTDGRRDVVMEQAVRELAALRRKYEALVDVDQAWNATKVVPASKRRKSPGTSAG